MLLKNFSTDSAGAGIFDLPLFIHFSCDTTPEQVKNYWRAFAKQRIEHGDWNRLEEWFSPECATEFRREFTHLRPP